MEGLNNASSNSNQQQPISTEATPFISSLTAVAPTLSQVVDDFQSDPKWEFTPLEKASLDCIEMEAATFDTGSNDQPVEQPIGSPSRDQSETASNVDGGAQIQQHAQENKAHEETNEKKIIEEPTISSTDLNIIHASNIDTSNNSGDMIGRNVVTEEIIETEQSDHVTELLLPAADSTTNSSNANASATTNFNKEPVTSTLNDQHITETQSDTSVQHKTSDSREDVSANIFLSQTSVDAQMEKVIDNVVELGGGQHFGQVLGRTEDKAKVLESIHREITSDRSSMEIMADIALQQLPLVTESTTASRVTVHQQDIVEEKIDEALEDVNKISSQDDGLPEKVEHQTSEQNLAGQKQVQSEPKVQERAVSNEAHVDKMVEEDKVIDEHELEKNKALEIESKPQGAKEKGKKPAKPEPKKQSPRKSAVKKQEPKPKPEPISELEFKPQHEEVKNEFQKIEAEEEPEKPAEASRPIRSMRIRIPKKLQDDSPPKPEPAKVKSVAKRSRQSVDNDLNKSYEASKKTLMIKLPTQRSRATISTSNPTSRPSPASQKRKRSPSPEENNSLIEKKYTCSECSFSTDRLNNVVFHYTKSYCPGKCQMVEDMKANIIKQQQTPKGNRNKRSAR